MKKQVTVSLGMLGLLWVCTLATAQAQSMRFNIPFDFVAAGTTFPAGDYRVAKSYPNQSTVSLTGEKGGPNAICLTNSLQSLHVSETGKLIFNRYGNQYFLSQVWAPGAQIGQRLPASKAEREIARNAAKPRSELLTAQK
jgi:hypothetical protein